MNQNPFRVKDHSSKLLLTWGLYDQLAPHIHGHKYDPSHAECGASQAIPLGFGLSCSEGNLGICI